MENTTDLRVDTERDLKKVLKSMDLWDDYRSENLYCEFCGVLILPKTLASLFSYRGRFAAGCNRYECYKYFLGLSINQPPQKE